ncbi:hypothetical protein KUTeg_015559 [Tegillarca granosa]|uniref:C17orf113 probable zinc finger domain-containing protein n=1 Tax=Tegillarca granosa TaxID=220873 RepID=A0ABQ9EQN3_TEGGR|nr:hypothetical protein KUTeg_015559 [Tegillarca granosa]
MESKMTSFDIRKKKFHPLSWVNVNWTLPQPNILKLQNYRPLVLVRIAMLLKMCSKHQKKKTEKPDKVVHTSKTPSTRKFMDTWKFGRSWLRYDHKTKLMYCDICIKAQVCNSFTTGCDVLKKESVIKHESRCKVTVVADVVYFYSLFGYRKENKMEEDAVQDTSYLVHNEESADTNKTDKNQKIAHEKEDESSEDEVLSQVQQKIVQDSLKQPIAIRKKTRTVKQKKFLYEDENSDSDKASNKTKYHLQSSKAKSEKRRKKKSFDEREEDRCL